MFKVGQQVRINLPEDAFWSRRSGQNTLVKEDVNQKPGIITQALVTGGQREYKVKLDVGEFRFWERDLAEVEDEAEPEPELNDGEPAT